MGAVGQNTCECIDGTVRRLQCSLAGVLQGTKTDGGLGGHSLAGVLQRKDQKSLQWMLTGSLQSRLQTGLAQNSPSRVCMPLQATSSSQCCSLCIAAYALQTISWSRPAETRSACLNES